MPKFRFHSISWEQIDIRSPNFIYAFILTRSTFGLLHIIFRTFVPEKWPLINARVSFTLNTLRTNWQNFTNFIYAFIAEPYLMLKDFYMRRAICKLRLNAHNLLIETSQKVRGGSICNENPFITPSTNALASYAICQTKDQSVAVKMVHETLYNYWLMRHWIWCDIDQKIPILTEAYRPDNTNIDRDKASVNIGIIWSILHHIQCLISQ